MKVAMILAAGRGERLRPLTDTLPKALFRVREKPLIEHHVINLAKAGFERIVINHAWLGGQIRRYLGNGKAFGVEICYSPEPPGGLETGGGIVQALPFFEGQPFLTVNADIYTDFDFRQIQAETVEYLHLILVPKDPALHHYGDFGLSKGKLTNSNNEYTYGCIACYHPRVFEDYHLGRFSVVPILRHYADQYLATASVHQGCWFDIGSVERLDVANSTGMIAKADYLIFK